jgi:hypothetical protein
MSNLSSVQAAERTNIIIQLVFYGCSAIFALMHELAIETVLIVVLCTFILVINRFYKLRLIPDDSSDDNFKTLSKLLATARTTFIVLCFILPLLCIAFNETHRLFPRWQEEFIKENFIKNNEERESAFYKIPVDSLGKHPEFIQEHPMLLVNNKANLYLFDNSIINQTIIKYASNSFNDLAFGLVIIILIITIFYIPVDLIASNLCSLAKSKSSSK